MTACYKFCGVTVAVEAPLPRREDGQAAPFRVSEQTPDLTVKLEPRQGLPAPEGRFCGRAGDRRVWRDGETVVRQVQDQFRPRPHMVSAYSAADLHEVSVQVEEEDWTWATGTKYLWAGLALNQLLLHFGCLFFHASYIAHNGAGVLFTAPSQTGKSTQAELWRKHRGAEVVNGDKAAVSLRGTPMVHSVPFAGTSGICKNVSLPLRAIVVLSQAPENTVRRLSPSEIAASLMGNIFVDRTVSEEWSAALNLLLDLAAAVPVYALACTPDVRAVETLENAMDGKDDRL